MSETSEAPKKKKPRNPNAAKAAGAGSAKKKPQSQAAAPAPLPEAPAPKAELQRETAGLPAPAVPTAKKKRRKNKHTLLIFLYSLALIAAVAAAGYFGFLLFQGPQAKPVVDVATKKAAPVSSTIISASAPAPEPPKPQIQTTLAQIAKVEAAKQGTPGGPLYDVSRSNVALSFESIQADDPQVAEAQAVLAMHVEMAPAS